jgi:class 3 adenylate cyclase
LIGNRLELEETEPLRLKGKRQPFRAFKVLGVKPEGQDMPIPVPSGAGASP